MTQPSPSNAVLSNSIVNSPRQALDLNELKEHMLHGIYEIERFLYAQAVHETQAMVSSREIIQRLEADLFNPENMQFLSAKSKIELYRTVTSNVQANLKFIQALHGEVTTGLETIKSLTRETTAGAAREKTPDENQKLKAVKNLVLQKLKEKTQQQRGNSK